MTFTSSVPLHEFTGVSAQLNGLISPADSTVDFFVDLETIETGNGKRDRDMRRTLDTAAFPFAEFTGNLVTPLDLSITEPQEARVQGLFKIHGVERQLSVEGTLQVSNGQLVLKAAWTLNIEDFNIEPPRLLLIRVDKMQKISIEARLTPVSRN